MSMSAPVDIDIDPTLPEPVRRMLASGVALDAIVLDAEGRWHHQGQPFRNRRLQQLFHRSIQRTQGGTWVLHVPPFTYPIHVEDTPYHVRSLHIVPAASSPRVTPEYIVLSLSDDTEEILDPTTLRYFPGRGLYCRVKGGTAAARCNSPAYYSLAERITESAGECRGESAGESPDESSNQSPAAATGPPPATYQLHLGGRTYAIDTPGPPGQDPPV